ncbi:hypothetical protein MIND_00744700 [Mycena indigotica]|uniref:Structure-specific endonuclease subunit SLX4 n=1 Tax=Mycena indigotica TaxID=2126181 RepID=A0A8H6SL73_9AGAR|nr:uncharacterized protein MIND_00744700 [Mycena indigotica]KAF7301790.1 hypothetical protein MIND_00744700 [Mycena indigotica]
MSRHIVEEVPDSEPEREAERQARKQERKKRKLTRTATPEIIVISDDSSAHSPVIAPSKSPSVINISDNSINVDQNVISISTSVEAPPDEDDDVELVPTLNIGRFAFQNTTRPLQQRNSASTIGSSSNSEAPAKPAARRSRKHLEEISDNDLNKLSKCVSCSIPWTTRKTAAQKMIHIRSCAKKSGMTDETVVFLVRKEIENSPATGGKGNAAPLTGPSTLLEEVVRDAGPKRKGKRPLVVDVLKPVSETRNNILDRARNLLTETDDPPTQAAVIPPTTPSLGASRLGRKQQGKVALFDDSDEESDFDPPAATQAFAPSKLGGGTKKQSAWGYDSEPESEPVASSSKPSRAKGPSQIASLMTKMTLDPSTLERSHTPESDDGYIHYEPSNYPIPPPPPPRGKKKQLPTITDVIPQPNQRKRRTTSEAFDEAALLNKILEDEALHLQILRYEAVDFNTFLALVLQPGETASPKTKLQMQSFLDKQAIVFFGGETRNYKSRGRRGRR